MAIGSSAHFAVLGRTFNLIRPFWRSGTALASDAADGTNKFAQGGIEFSGVLAKHVIIDFPMSAFIL
jgi:hypothetical protein